MSAKKSWDIQSRPSAPRSVQAPRAPVSRPVPAPAARPAPVQVPATRRVAPQETAVQVKRSPNRAVAAPARTGRLADRRRSARRARFKGFVVVLCVLLIAGVIALWQSPLRIQTVVVSGPDAERAEAIAQSTLDSTFGFIVPRDSTFFYPEDEIRSNILMSDPNIAAVSLKRSSLTTLSITTSSRAAAALWCGESTASSTACFRMDSQGLVFDPDEATSTITTASTSGTASAKPASIARIYGPLEEGSDLASSAGARMQHAADVMDILKFVRAIEGLGIDVTHTVLSGDEAELHTAVGTRIVYVIGNEEQAAGTAASALPPLDIPSGTYDYVDLRFDGKAYVKRVGE